MGSVTSSQRIHGYISVTNSLKFTEFFKVQEKYFIKNNRIISFIGDVFISHDR